MFTLPHPLTHVNNTSLPTGSTHIMREMTHITYLRSRMYKDANEFQEVANGAQRKGGEKWSSTWLITNFRIPAFSSATKAIWVMLGIARWNGKDASGKGFPSRCKQSIRIKRIIQRNLGMTNLFTSAVGHHKKHKERKEVKHTKYNTLGEKKREVSYSMITKMPTFYSVSGKMKHN